MIFSGDFIARPTEPTPHGDGELWFVDWNKCSLEAMGEWEEVKRAVMGAGLAPLSGEENARRR